MVSVLVKKNSPPSTNSKVDFRMVLTYVSQLGIWEIKCLESGEEIHDNLVEGLVTVRAQVSVLGNLGQQRLLGSCK